MKRQASPSPLWLALRLPHLPLEALDHSYNSATPVIVSEQRRVFRCTALALAEGVTYGMPLSTAQSLVAGLVLERDSEREQQAVQQLAELCYQFTPYIEFYGDPAGDCGLLLEISRCLTLFKGTENLVQQLTLARTQSPRCGTYHCQYGLAHTGKAAWLLSRQHHAISTPGDGRSHNERAVFWQRLRQVPVDHLREFPDIIPALHKSGFHTLGELMTQIGSGQANSTSSALRRRFGHEFSDYLEDILGSRDPVQQTQLFSRPAEIFTPDNHFQEHIQFDYPVTDVEQLREPMQQLLARLIDKLRKEQQQCHSLQWHFFDIYQNRQTLTVNSERIHGHWQLPLDLTMIQLEHTALEFAVDSVELLCDNTTPVDISNHQLLGQSATHTLAADSEKLFARLAARLGKKALSKISYRDDPLPENCQQEIAITEASNMRLPPQHLNAPRPSWLFSPPQAIQQHQQQLIWHGPLKLLQGPERLQGHWWDSPAARDYFLAQRSDDLRCWVYQDLHSRQWYVHGIFS